MSASHKNQITVLGIDPGKTGGIACLKPDHTIVTAAMPPTDGDLHQLLRQLVDPGKTVAFVELVSGYIGKEQPGARMFTFGKNFGIVLGLLYAMQVRIELIRPQKWQKALSLGSASTYPSRTAWKNQLKGVAQQLYPSIQPTLATSDALLLLEYGVRQLRSGSIARRKASKA